MGPFWATVASVELMDLAFSLDNVFAAVALAGSIPEPQKLYVVMIGVFLGILAMRFVAQYFVKLLEKYPALEKAAFTVIGVLGAKLILSGMCHVLDRSPFCRYFEGEQANLVFSLLRCSSSSYLFSVPYSQNTFAKGNFATWCYQNSDISCSS
jgi:predicted tellurium resistance membrane protein TerC